MILTKLCILWVAVLITWLTFDNFSKCKNIKNPSITGLLQGCIRFGHSPPPPPQTERHNGYFLHVTDLHLDEDYTAGSNVKTACHRKQVPEDENRVTRIGRLGAPGVRCDAPVELARQTLEWISREWKDKLDFVIWTGDSSRHDWDSKQIRRRNQVLKLNKLAADMLTEHLDGVPVIPSLGNNDVFPHNKVLDHDSIFTFYENIWRSWIPAEQRKTFLKGGYFSTDTGNHMRVISLNTMYFTKRNTRVKGCDKKGPSRDHIQWFEAELDRARKDGNRVIVMGHVPPSPHDYSKYCFREYLSISGKYSDVIAGHHYGHLNMDHFLLYDSSREIQPKTVDIQVQSEFHVSRNILGYVDWLRDLYSSISSSTISAWKKKPVSNNVSPLIAVQVSPSILPIYYPAVRVYRYSMNNGNPAPSLLGYIQYYANITRWEREHPNEPLEYDVEYTSEQEYGLTDLSPESLSKLAKSMLEEEGDMLWNTYTRNMFVRTQNDTFPFDDDDDDDDDEDDDDDDDGDRDDYESKSYL